MPTPAPRQRHWDVNAWLSGFAASACRMPGSTTHLGRIATASTSDNAPYDIARRFATLDLLSGGRPRPPHPAAA